MDTAEEVERQFNVTIQDANIVAMYADQTLEFAEELYRLATERDNLVQWVIAMQQELFE